MLNSAVRLFKFPLAWLSSRRQQREQHRVSINPVFSHSQGGRRWDTTRNIGLGGWCKVSNLSGGYHGLLRQWWEAYGLGRRILLVSETAAVRKEFEAMYPGKQFVATDYFTELTPGRNPPDVAWNMYEEAPPALRSGGFSSVICQATLEHLHDPVGVLRRLAALLDQGGHLYIHTHCPGFQYHPYPRDYLRFYPDWFQDIPLTIPQVEVIEIHCAEGYAFCVLRKK